MSEASSLAAPRSLPRLLLYLEGAAILGGAVAVYLHLSGSALLFGVLFFVPDLSMLGYLRDTRTGAQIYNAAHTYTLPMLLLIAGLVTGNDTPLHLALIWAAHIGMDRAIGFGLKYAGAFKDTHLQRV